MNNRQVAEAFANYKQHARGSNFFIEEGILYSYGHHFPVAKHTTGHFADKPIVLFNSSKYSHSTSKHQSYAYHALSYSYFIVECDLNYDQPAYWANEIDERIKELIGKAKRARLESNREYYLEQVEKNNEQWLAITNLI